MVNGKIVHLRNFLEKLDVIRKRYEDIEARKDQFNIFTAMFDESDEVNLHSQFIFSLLNFKTGNEAAQQYFSATMTPDVAVRSMESSVLMYRGGHGKVQVQVIFDTNTFWLSQQRMAEFLE